MTLKNFSALSARPSESWIAKGQSKSNPSGFAVVFLSGAAPDKCGYARFSSPIFIETGEFIPVNCGPVTTHVFCRGMELNLKGIIMLDIAPTVFLEKSETII